MTASAPAAAPSSAELLRVSALHAFYGESHILHGVDLAVGTGELVTLLGRNGSGRTTTLKAILGLVDRRTGSVMVKGVGKGAEGLPLTVTTNCPPEAASAGRVAVMSVAPQVVGAMVRPA